MAKYQHQPVSPPDKWTPEEKRMVYLIDRLFDEVYQKIGDCQSRITALESEETEEDDG